MKIAAIDVFEDEPIYDTNNWALQMENVLCTPHLGYVEKNGYEYYFELVFKNVVDFFKRETGKYFIIYLYIYYDKSNFRKDSHILLKENNDRNIS